MNMMGNYGNKTLIHGKWHELKYTGRKASPEEVAEQATKVNAARDAAVEAEKAYEALCKGEVTRLAKAAMEATEHYQHERQRLAMLIDGVEVGEEAAEPEGAQLAIGAAGSGVLTGTLAQGRIPHHSGYIPASR